MTDVNGTIDWAEIWSEHGSAMLRAARTELRGDVADGHSDEDIVIKVLTDMIRNPGPFQRAQNQRAYLVTAVRKQCMTKLKRGNRPKAPQEPGQIEDPVGEAAADAVLASAIAGCIDRLTPKQQMAIERRVMNGERATDVAAEMGCSTQMVSQHVNAGLAQLRKDPTFIRLTTQVDTEEQP